MSPIRLDSMEQYTNFIEAGSNYSQKILRGLQRGWNTADISAEFPHHGWVVLISIPHLNVICFSSRNALTMCNVHDENWYFHIHSDRLRDEVDAISGRWIWPWVRGWSHKTTIICEVSTTRRDEVKHIVVQLESFSIVEIVWFEPTLKVNMTEWYLFLLPNISHLTLR